MATLAIENISFTLTAGVGIDEYTQSGHGPSPALKLLNASGPISRGLSLILFTPERTSQDGSAANKDPFAHDYASVVLVLGASGSFGIVRFEKQTDGTRRAGRRSRCREWF